MPAKINEAGAGANPSVLLKNLNKGRKATWISENTAIFVAHGIGNQHPMETLEQFGKNLIKTYQKHLGAKNLTIEHRIRHKEAGNGERDWYDNYLRIKYSGSANYIDIYEYYWAHYTEGKAEWGDVNNWLQGVTSGAKKFYKRNLGLSASMRDISVLTKSGFRYQLFINVMSRALLLAEAVWSGVRGLMGYIPLIGGILQRGYESYSRSISHTLTNIIGDLVAYSVTDAKSKYYPIRRAILDGCVKALLFLIEDGVVDSNGKFIGGKNGKRSYEKIIIAGHSLGSLVVYDALNQINLMVNSCLVESYQSNGHCQTLNGRSLQDQLCGLITFGSPLDKSAFFLRENIPDDQFVRQQLLNHYMNFKQKDWTPDLASQTDFFPVENQSTSRLLENVPWRNYFDQHDYVSGDLDYYGPLTNVDCSFSSKNWFRFTHSNYWDCMEFYDDIILNFLKPSSAKKPVVSASLVRSLSNDREGL